MLENFLIVHICFNLVVVLVANFHAKKHNVGNSDFNIVIKEIIPSGYRAMLWVSHHAHQNNFFQGGQQWIFLGGGQKDFFQGGEQW